MKILFFDISEDLRKTISEELGFENSFFLEGGTDLVTLYGVNQRDTVLFSGPKLSAEKIQALRDQGLKITILTQSQNNPLFRIRYLDAGADAVVNRGSCSEEICAVIRSLFRFQNRFSKLEEWYTCLIAGEEMRIRHDLKEILWGNQAIADDLKASPRKILALLVRNVNSIVGYEDFFKNIWNDLDESDFGNKQRRLVVLRTQMSHIRKVFAKVSVDLGFCIQTVPGIGYQLVT
jgi:DNA-binding response OmpR family regulator